MKRDPVKKRTPKYPVSNPRNIKAEVIYYLELSATAFLFVLILFVGFIIC